MPRRGKLKPHKSKRALDEESKSQKDAKNAFIGLFPAKKPKVEQSAEAGPPTDAPTDTGPTAKDEPNNSNTGGRVGPYASGAAAAAAPSHRSIFVLDDNDLNLSDAQSDSSSDDSSVASDTDTTRRAARRALPKVMFIHVRVVMYIEFYMTHWLQSNSVTPKEKKIHVKKFHGSAQEGCLAPLLVNSNCCYC